MIKFSKQNKINCTNLRVFNVLGNDDKKINVVNFINKNKYKKLIFNNIASVRDYIWIEDFLFCLEKIIENNKKNYKAINIGTGKGTSILKILRNF